MPIRSRLGRRIKLWQGKIGRLEFQNTFETDAWTEFGFAVRDWWRDLTDHPFKTSRKYYGYRNWHLQQRYSCVYPFNPIQNVLVAPWQLFFCIWHAWKAVKMTIILERDFRQAVIDRPQQFRNQGFSQDQINSIIKKYGVWWRQFW